MHVMLISWTSLVGEQYCIIFEQASCSVINLPETNALNLFHGSGDEIKFTSLKESSNSVPVAAFLREE